MLPTSTQNCYVLLLFMCFFFCGVSSVCLVQHDHCVTRTHQRLLHSNPLLFSSPLSPWKDILMRKSNGSGYLVFNGEYSCICMVTEWMAKSEAQSRSSSIPCPQPSSQTSSLVRSKGEGTTEGSTLQSSCFARGPRKVQIHSHTSPVVPKFFCRAPFCR